MAMGHASDAVGRQKNAYANDGRRRSAKTLADGMIGKMKHLIGIAVVLLAGVAGHANAASLRDTWQSAPVLGGAVADLECEAAREHLATIEAAAAAALTSAQIAAASGPSAAAVTDDQGAALETLSDPALQECSNEANSSLRSISEDTYRRINEAAGRLNEALDAEDDKCGNEMSDGYGECYLRVHRKYEALAQDEARKILDQFQAERAEWRKTTESCIERREAAVDTFTAAGMIGPFASLGESVRTMSWGIVYADQEAVATMCEAIRESAHSFDFNE